MAGPERPTVTTRSYDGRELRHAHGFHQIVLPVAGSLQMEVGAARGTVGDDRGAIVPGGTAHSFRGCGSNRFVVLDLPPHALLPDRAIRSSAEAFFEIDAALAALVRYLAFEAADTPMDSPTAHHASALLLRAIERRRPAATPADPIDRALSLMRDRCTEPLTVAELAAAAGLGRSRFHALFRARTGMTPARLLTQLRLDRADALLRSGDMAIAEVALAVGFSEQSALTRSLKRQRGVTPAALRRG